MKEIHQEFKRLIRIRDEWISGLSVENKELLFFELEMLLKAVERFFNINNHPLWTREEASAKNFSQEVKILKTGVERIMAITRNILENDSNLIHFQKYIENKISRDSARDKIILESMEQKDPKSSLFLLTINLMSLYEIIKFISEMPKCDYLLFNNLGHIAIRLISTNLFFDPIKLPIFSPLYDRINNPKILKIVKKVKSDREKKVVSVIFLAFFRFLKYLKFINAEDPEEVKLKANLLIFSLLKSELREIINYIENEAPYELKGEKGAEDLLSFLKGIRFQLELELKKVYKNVLKDFVAISSTGALRANVDTARGVLTNNFQQVIVNLAKFLSPDVEGKEIFVDFVSRLENSLRLREDLWIYREILSYAELCLKADENSEHYRPPKNVVAMLRDFLIYFQNLSFTLLRYADLEPFEEFARYIFNLYADCVEKKTGEVKVDELREKIHSFRIYVETTLSHVNNRAELRDVPFHIESAKELLEQFII
jgi:hypothetical protein